MKNHELIKFLHQYPGDMDIKFLMNSTNPKCPAVDLTEDDILHTSETAVAIADEEFQESATDFISLGNGKQYLLINPIQVLY